MYTEDNLKNKTQAELVEIANELKLNVDAMEDKELLTQEILRAQEQGAKRSRNTRNKPKKALTPKQDKPDPEERISVIFHETSAPDGDAPVKMSLNGEPVVAKRGEPVDIKRKFLKGVVDNAVMTEFMRDESTGNVRVRQVPRFPYSLA